MTSAAALALVLAPTAGKLFLAGGGTTPDAVMAAFVQACGPEAHVAVLGQAREEPMRAASSAEWLLESGFIRVTLLSWDAPDETQKAAAARVLADVQGVWIPGGDQNLITQRWGVEWLREHLGGAVARGAHVFGTSAGAMVMSDPMIAGPGEGEGTAELAPGLGLTALLVDTHVRDRDRQPRLRDALSRTTHPRALGLSEGEWVVLQGDVVLEVHGDPVWIERE